MPFLLRLHGRMKRFLGFILVALIGVLSQVAPSPAVAAATSVVGVMERKSVTYTNSQTIDYTFSSAAIVGASGSEFHLLSTTCLATIRPGGTCTLELDFTPKFEGSRWAHARLYVAGSNLSTFERVDLNYLVSGNCTDATFASGTGTTADPFGIATPAQLNCMNATTFGDSVPRYWNKAFYLSNDIDLRGVDFNPIGSLVTPFRGIFDGRGKRISNLVSSALVGGMFAALGNSGQVRNIELYNPSVTALFRAGALAGSASANDGNTVTIENVHVIGGHVFSASASQVGGLVGLTTRAQIRQSSASAAVSGIGLSTAGPNLGGLVGLAEVGSTIVGCFATGAVSYTEANPAQDASVGGLVGKVSGTTISDSYALGSVTSNSTAVGAGLFGGAGGFVGQASGATITRSFAGGLVQGAVAARTGGFVGYEGTGINAVYSQNFWDLTTSEQSSDFAHNRIQVAGQVDPKTSAELTSLSTFTSAGWPFEPAVGSENYWVLLPTSYPTLAHRPSINAPRLLITYSEPTYAPQASFRAKEGVNRVTLRRTSEISLEGGSGQGALTFKSLTEDICEVDLNGVVSGLASGKCEVEVVKAAEGFYTEAKTKVVVEVLTPYQKLGLSPEAITADEIRSIRGRYLSYLRSDLFQQLSTTALAALSLKQIKVITKRQFAALSKDQRKALKR